MNNIFSGIEKVSLVDFDSKVACTLFTYGCNFRCPFCHNAHLFEADYILEWDEIYAYLKKRRGVVDAVVVTGGEPTIHKELKEYLKIIKDLGYLIKLDTNGSNPTVLKELIDLGLVDYVAMDIKSSEATYPTITKSSIDISKIKESIHILMTSKINYEFRTTLIKEFHNEEDIISLGKLIMGAKVLYLQKFILRETCPDQALHEVSVSDARKFKDILSKDIKKVVLREYE